MTDIDATSGRPVNTTNAQIVYLMHLLAPFTLWTLALLAVIIGIFARDAARGTYVESHYAWLSRTFYFGLGWLIIGTIVFVMSIVGILLLWLLWGGLTIWYLYRVIRGWLRLNDRLPAPD